METRRSFIRRVFGSLLGSGVLLGPLLPEMQQAWAASKKIPPKGTKRESLIQENPAALDTTNLEITPLEEFGTMGPTSKVVGLATWRLELSGKVKRPLSLTYAQLTALPAIEREVLLICPGVFANHGRWKGFSLKVFLAYQVNGKELPRKHGSPLRVIAEDYYGSDWVKYVDRITVETT
jgi:sulfoxide reductase catalytic subunit YedY